MAADIISSTTQQFLDIHDIANNYVIMKDGTVSVLITVDAMNFGLLAEEEQDAVMYAYAGLLNSLNYPVQIVINSQTKDVTSYLQLLKDQEGSSSNETIRRRIRQYREFVGNLIQDRNVLDKKFYVVIPANSIELGFAGAKSVLPGSAKFDINSIERSILIEKAQNILDPRRDHMIAQFARIGLFSRQLSTQEIIQLFYVRYNPEATEGQQIGESSSYSSPLVQASIQGSTMNTDPLISPTLGGTQPTSDTQDYADPSVGAPTSPDSVQTDPMASPSANQPWQAPAAPSPTQTIPSPMDSISNVLGQKTASEAPGSAMPPSTTPPAPAATSPAVPPVTPPLTTSAPPDMGDTVTASPSAAAVPNNEVAVQADLNETFKQLGVEPTEGTPASTSAPATESIESVPTVADNSTPANDSSTSASNQAGDLPPLPEI